MGLADRVREIVGIAGQYQGIWCGSARTRPTLFVPAAQVQDGLTKLVNQAMPLVWVVRTTGDAVRAWAATQMKVYCSRS